MFDLNVNKQTNKQTNKQPNKKINARARLGAPPLRTRNRTQPCNKCIPHHLHERALAYSDNIYVYTKIMNLLTHLGDVALVLADLEKNGITAKPSKSFFAMQRLRVIGLIVSKLGIQVNPDRLQSSDIMAPVSCFKYTIRLNCAAIFASCGNISYIRPFLVGTLGKGGVSG